jgi:aldehyde dehydrogenase
LASSNRIAKVSFTGETTTGRLIMQYASQNLIPVTLELGGKSPNIFFSDVMAANDNFQDKALEGFTMFALNQGEVCTCPSRSLIQADIHDEFLELAAIRTKAIRQGDPLDTETMLGSQASNDQLEKILSYIEIGKGRAPRSSPAASAPSWAVTCPAATTCSRRSSAGTTRCASSRRRFSGRW